MHRQQVIALILTAFKGLWSGFIGTLTLGQVRVDPIVQPKYMRKK